MKNGVTARGRCGTPHITSYLAGGKICSGARIYPLSIRDHVNSPIEVSIAGMLGEVTGFREILVAADRRLGRRRAAKMLDSFGCEAAKKVLLARWPEFRPDLSPSASNNEIPKSTT